MSWCVELSTRWFHSTRSRVNSVTTQLMFIRYTPTRVDLRSSIGFGASWYCGNGRPADWAHTHRTHKDSDQLTERKILIWFMAIPGACAYNRSRHCRRTHPTSGSSARTEMCDEAG